MPKNEFDPEDPMELCGVGLLTEEDTSEPMTECFIEEFLRMGYNAKQVLALFRNPHYTGMNMVMQNRGEQFVKDKIIEVFGWWKRPVGWAGQGSAGVPPAPQNQAASSDEHPESQCRRDACATFTDPMGASHSAAHAGGAEVAFPLTPALSLGEREKPTTATKQNACDLQDERPTEFPLLGERARVRGNATSESQSTCENLRCAPATRE